MPRLVRRKFRPIPRVRCGDDMPAANPRITVGWTEEWTDAWAIARDVTPLAIV